MAIQIPAWVISLGMTAISKKFAPESIEQKLVREANNIPRIAEFDKKGIKKAAPLWLAVVGIILFGLQSAGYIDPETVKAITEFFSNEAVQDSINGAIEASGD